MSSKKIRILLADDHTILRKGVRMLIDSQPDMEVVSEAKTGQVNTAPKRRGPQRTKKPDPCLAA